MIYQQINISAFRDAFIRMDRNVFSYKGYQALYDWLNDMGEDIELDVIALCCEFVELTYDEIRQDYQLDKELSDDEIVEWLCEQTSVMIYADDNAVMFGVF